MMAKKSPAGTRETRSSCSRKIFLILILGCALLVKSPYLSAQTSITGAQIRNPITPVETLPSTCKPYATYYLTSTKAAYICTATNTLTLLSGAGSQGVIHALQGSNGSGGFTETGCTAQGGTITCPSGFGTGGPFSATGAHQSATTFPVPSANNSSLVFDASNDGHLVRKDAGGAVHDLEVTRIGGYEVGAETATTALVTADLTNHSIMINDSTPKTLTEASCVTDNGAQLVTVKSAGVTLFTITCVAAANFSTAVADGSAGYISAASIASTTVPAHAQLDLSGTANGTTKNLKLYIHGAF